MQSGDVIFTFSWVTWEGAQRRGMHFAQDRLVARLLEEERVNRLLVANWFRSAPMKLARGLLVRDDSPPPAAPNATLHQPLRLRRRDPVSLAAIERTYRTYDRKLRRAAERAGLERPAVVTMHPLIAGFCSLEWAGPVTFYASDDWTASPEYRAWWPAFEEAYRRVRESGRQVCAVSSPIIDRIRPLGPSRVVPNGIEPGEWMEPGTPPHWFAALPEPRILYVGTLDTRLDIEQVEAVSAAFPEGSMTLVGPTKNPDHLAPLAARSNVVIHDRVPRSGIPGLMAAASVCVIPHNRTQFTASMSPLKAYEYLAAGRPVAAVDLPPLREVDPRMVLVRKGESFAAAVEAALRAGPASEPERLRFIGRNSWASRHEAVLELVLGATASRASAKSEFAAVPAHSTP
jgi:teichuronic acid biosynthesis glycosyltransferase TuaH